jgi:type IV secretion system protein VirB9
MKLKITPFIVAIGILLAPAFASAAKTRPAAEDPAAAVWVDPMAKPMALPADNRIVRFSYSPDIIYTILATVGYTTHIELQEDEGITEEPSLGDSMQWRVSGGPRNLYLKPVRPDIVTSMTIVTNKRSYQFDIRSGPIDGKRYQKIAFDYPDEQQRIKLRDRAVAQATQAEVNRIASQVVAKEINPAKLNFSYDIKGDSEFKPISVFDDGKFTYFKLAGNVQSLPPLFLIENDEYILVNYVVKGDTLVIERVAPKFALKLGSREVLIKKQTSWWGN